MRSLGTRRGGSSTGNLISVREPKLALQVIKLDDIKLPWTDWHWLIKQL